MAIKASAGCIRIYGQAILIEAQLLEKGIHQGWLALRVSSIIGWTLPMYIANRPMWSISVMSLIRIVKITARTPLLSGYTTYVTPETKTKHIK